MAGLHVGYMDTDMAQAATAPKTAPDAVARFAADGIAEAPTRSSWTTSAARRGPVWPEVSPLSTRSCPDAQPYGVANGSRTTCSLPCLR